MATTRKNAKIDDEPEVEAVVDEPRGWVWMRDRTGQNVRIMLRDVERLTARGFVLLPDKKD